MTIEEDGFAALQKVANYLETGKEEDSRGHYSFKGPELATLVEFAPNRLNDIVSMLESRGLAEVTRYFGTAPYSFGNILLTPLGRTTAEQVNDNTKQDEESKRMSDAFGFKSDDSIFVVHGHDDAARLEVTRFVENQDLEAIILHEQSNKGRTIIEKLMDHAESADFAIIILSPDDVGASQRDFDDAGTSLKPRARQNVILELGLFIGLLGREKVVALKQAGVDIPSDLHGVVYIEMDTNAGWKLKLANEMSDAGIKIDMKKLK